MAGRGPLPPHLFARGLPGQGILGPPLGLHPMELLPPNFLEGRFAAQAGDMQNLATENQRLLASHVILRQDLGTVQSDIERLQARMTAIQNEKEQQMRGILETRAKLEADMKALETIKTDLQQARSDAQNLIVARQELSAQVQQLTQELQIATVEAQHIPAMHAEIDNLSKDLQAARSAYEYEKAANTAQAEKNQAMEKNLYSMAREVEKLRAEIAAADTRGRASNVPYSGSYGNQDSSYLSSHSLRRESYGHSQISAGTDNPPSYTARGVSGWGASAYDLPLGGAAGSGYDIARLSGGTSGYDMTRGAGGTGGYDVPRSAAGSGAYDIPRGAVGSGGYDIPRGGGGSGGAGHLRM
eukprot:TRINITY_DN2912_c0_g1_i1.p1 TRINITY_DN2912_c0_g1~~TRINITY_DN2912_c0_g1_i1.p1  ORF type:complete len:356 (-),score=97.67 TRINITY_DN2912_c0_g1_i1:102-1169(-)